MKQKVAVVTGASRGLGKEIAVQLAEKGYQLALVARNQIELEQLVSELNRKDLSATAFPFDLSLTHDIESLFDKIVEQFPSIDLLVNNAGIGTYKPLAEHSINEIEAIISVNLTAPLVLNKLFSELMQSQRSGHIINIGSDLAQKPLANMTPYVASKHGLYGMSQSLLREVKSDNVKVTIINSGIVNSHFGDSAPLDDPDVKTALLPEQLASLVLQVVEQPHYQLIDELTVHPLHQEF